MFLITFCEEIEWSILTDVGEMWNKSVKPQNHFITLQTDVSEGKRSESEEKRQRIQKKKFSDCRETNQTEERQQQWLEHENIQT